MIRVVFVAIMAFLSCAGYSRAQQPLNSSIALVKPDAQYPEVAPPTISVTARYPGANALDVAENVATPIEQQVNGVENMIYMLSRCTNDGQMALNVIFKPGANLNMAQVLVQNRVSIAEPPQPAAEMTPHPRQGARPMAEQRTTDAQPQRSNLWPILWSLGLGGCILAWMNSNNKVQRYKAQQQEHNRQQLQRSIDQDLRQPR
jgi:hypothetical protein